MPPTEYSSKSDFSKAEVVRSQVVKCSEIRSKEMKKGYFNYTLDGKKVYISDSRKEWISAVKALRRLLEPECRRSDNFKSREKELKEKEKEIFEKYSYTPKKKEAIITKEGKREYKWIPIEGRKPYIPEVDAELLTDKDNIPNSYKTTFKPGIWNNYVNLYWQFLVEIYDELFAELCVLIDENNYFKTKVNYGFDIEDEIGEEDED